MLESQGEETPEKPLVDQHNRPEMMLGYSLEMTKVKVVFSPSKSAYFLRLDSDAHVHGAAYAVL